jgi:FkbM family methyltransferase
MPSHGNVINTSQGRFAIDPDQDAKMAKRLQAPVYPQQETIDLALALNVKEAVDVGAHVGTVSIPLAKHGVGVVAFEPNKESFDHLTYNATLNNVSIDIRNKGLSDTPGQARSVELHGGNAGAHSLREGSDIEVSTLDQEIEKTDFIKIDVEGMELSVLQGGSQLLEHSRPVVFFEVNLAPLRSHRTQPRLLQSLFSMHRYKLYLPVEKTLYKISNLSVVVALFTPRSFFFGGPSALFDVVAIPQERSLPLPTRSSFGTFVYLLSRYFSIQYERIFH